MATTPTSNFQQTLLYLDDLSRLTESSKPCFNKEGRLEIGTGNPYLRTTANLTNPITSRLGIDSETQRTIKPLTEFVQKIDQFFGTAEFERLRKEDYILLAYKTRAAAEGLGKLIAEYHSDPHKSSIVQNAISSLERRCKYTHQKIEFCEAENEIAHTKKIFDSFIDVQNQRKIQTLTEQNQKLLEENRSLLQQVRQQHAELTSRSPASDTMRDLSCVLTAFEQTPPPQQQKMDRRHSFS